MKQTPSKHILLYNIQFLLFGIIVALLFVLVVTRGHSPLVRYTKPAEKETMKKMFGVTMAGGEFGEKVLPGIMNKDYIYPTNGKEYAYFAAHGMSLIRLPIRWERIQDTTFAPLRGEDITQIKLAITVAEKNHQRVIIDLHNFGLYFGKPLTIKDQAAFADIWTKLAQEFKNDQTILGFELMNEPHDLPEGEKGWQILAQGAVNAIRKVDTIHTIFIPGYDWQSADRWRLNNETLTISDPGNNIIFAAHEYFDSDHSGEYKKSYDDDGAYPSIGIDRLKPFQSWLQDHKQKGIITEFGVPDTDKRWLTVLDKFMAAIQNDSHIVGSIYWAAGPWYGDYPLSIDPLKNENSPQMQIISKYTSDH